MAGIDYPTMLQAALRDTVRQALTVVAEGGLPGESHFYLSFRTGDAGVELHETLRSLYPDEMTIVLQHEFWDLEVSVDAFSVTLAFSGVHRRLRVPFAALTSFVDPSADFGLRFAELDADETPGPSPAAEAAPERRDGAPAPVVSLDAFRKR